MIGWGLGRRSRRCVWRRRGLCGLLAAAAVFPHYFSRCSDEGFSGHRPCSLMSSVCNHEWSAGGSGWGVGGEGCEAEGTSSVMSTV